MREAMPDGRPWPLISIVTPSFNQGPFLEHAIQSVVQQGYPRLEFIVMDGGSTDESAAILARYEASLTHWRSEPDDGPADALNKGFALATGEIFGFLNADDFYLPGCFEKVATAFAARPSIDVIAGHAYFADASGALGPPVLSDRWRMERVHAGACLLVQPATFFRRAAFERVGGFRRSGRSTWDMEAWADMAAAGAAIETRHEFLAAFRLHGGSITGAASGRRARRSDARAVRAEIRGRPETSLDRFWKGVYRAARLVSHPWLTLRQRWYFRRTLGRWSL